MTAWSDVKRFIHTNYKAEDVQDDLIRLVFGTNDLRSQVVFLAHETSNDGVEWLRVNSPVGSTAEVDLMRVATSLADKIVGGAIVFNDYVFVTNCIPLLNLDSNELVEPMLRVLSIADELEAQLTLKDLH